MYDESLGLSRYVPEIGVRSDDRVHPARFALSNEQRRDGEPYPSSFFARCDDGHRVGQTSPETSDRVTVLGKVGERVLSVDHEDGRSA
jgi:hypothetical protein